MRVRHEADRARIEVGADEVERLQRECAEIEPLVRAAGFESARIDPMGYRSGGADRAA